jgi:WD40 repeat protein
LHDRDRYVCLGRDGVLGVWSAAELKLLRLVPTDAGIVSDVLYSAEHKRLVLASTHAKLVCIDVANMRLQPGGALRLEYVPHSLCSFGADAIGDATPQCLVIGDHQGHIHFVEWTALLAGEVAPRMSKRVHGGCVGRLGWVSELNGLLSCSADGTLQLSEVALGAICPRTVLRSLAGQPISSFAWCAAQALVATSSRCERVIHLWSLSIASPVASLVGHAAAICQIEFDEKSNQVRVLQLERALQPCGCSPWLHPTAPTRSAASPIAAPAGFLQSAASHPQAPCVGSAPAIWSATVCIVPHTQHRLAATPATLPQPPAAHLKTPRLDTVLAFQSPPAISHSRCSSLTALAPPPARLTFAPHPPFYSLQLVSLAVDQSIRVWDVLSNKCMQVFEGEIDASEDSAMLLDRLARTLLVGQRRLARHCSVFSEELPTADTPSDAPSDSATGRGGASLHDLIGAAFSSKFNLALSVDEAFTVQTWELDSGAPGFRFNAERDSRTHHSASTPLFTAGEG